MMKIMFLLLGIIIIICWAFLFYKIKTLFDFFDN